MKATEIFGTHLRDIMSYLSFHNTSDGMILREEYKQKRKLSFSYSAWSGMIENAHTFLSQPMEERWFVRGEEPPEVVEVMTDIGYSAEQNRLYVEWQNWTPMFNGLEVVKEDNPFSKKGYHYSIKVAGHRIGLIEQFKTLNDFATHCDKQRIELELHERFEV